MDQQALERAVGELTQPSGLLHGVHGDKRLPPVLLRLLALLIMLPLLTIFADVVSIIGGMWVAQTYAHISADTFLASARQTVGFEDVVKGLIKTLVFAAIIAMVGAYQGLKTRGGAAGVGESTTGSVVLSIILIFISNFVLSLILFGGG